MYKTADISRLEDLFTYLVYATILDADASDDAKSSISEMKSDDNRRLNQQKARLDDQHRRANVFLWVPRHSAYLP